MKKAVLVVPILVLFVSCSIEEIMCHIGPIPNVRLTVKNNGRFPMRVVLEYPNWVDNKYVSVGQTAVWTGRDGLRLCEQLSISAWYEDARLEDSGLWETSLTLSDGDNVTRIVSDCPGWSGPYFGPIAYGNGLFLSLGSEGPMWSSDGTSWKISKTGFKQSVWDIAFGNDRFMVLYNISGDANGIEWITDITTGTWSAYIDCLSGARSIAYGNGGFMAIGYTAFWSTDGRSRGSWSTSDPGDSIFVDIAFGNDRFVAVDRNGMATCSSSGTMSSWTVSKAASAGLCSIAYGNGRFVAVGQNGVASWSPDGSPGSWTESKACSRTLAAVAFGNGRFVAVGKAGEVVWSPNGSPGSWIEARTGGTDLNWIAYGNGRFVTAGWSDRVLSSPDGSAGTWTEIRYLPE